jgi:hypothetical protein
MGRYAGLGAGGWVGDGVTVAGRGGWRGCERRWCDVTVTEALCAGLCTVFPCGSASQPNASSVNYVAGATVAKCGDCQGVGVGGRVCCSRSAATDSDGWT